MVERRPRSRQKRRKKQELLGNHQRCWLWGKHLVSETLKAAKWPIHELRLGTGLEPEVLAIIQDAADDLGVPCFSESNEGLTRLCGSGEHQGYLAKMPPYPYDDRNTLEEEWPETPLYLMLDGIQDPYNFGAILRSAEVLGADAVLIGTRNQTGVTSQVARSSAGAVNYLNIIRHPDLLEVLIACKERGVKLLGASEKSSVPSYEVDCTSPLLILIGNEGTGIRPELLAICDERVAIPQSGHVGSLNAAVSAGILLYEIHRQRTFAKKR